MANTQLLGYFLDKGERSAAGIQAIGVLSNYAVLLQVPALQLNCANTAYHYADLNYLAAFSISAWLCCAYLVLQM